MKILYTLLIAGIALTAVACSDDGDDEAQAAPGTRPAAGSAVAREPGARVPASGGPTQGGGGGARRGMSITLAASDVATVQRRPLERGIAITGDLRPIERIEIRSRLEGDVLAVHAREGQRVSAGQVLARFESIEQESARQSAEADRVAANTDVQTAQWDLEQTRELFREGAIPERDMRAAEQVAATARARLAAAQTRLRSATMALNDTRVTAPMSGVIEARHVSPGERVNRSAPLFTLVRSNVLELAAAVPAVQASEVRVGQTIRFSAANRTVIGRVARISPTVDPASRAVTVFVQIPNPNGALRGGTFATGRLVLSTGEVISVPSGAIRHRADGGSPFVYRISGSGELDQVDVRIGFNDEAAGQVEIVDGLQAGDRIVVGNVGTLGRGMKVQIVGGETQRR
ncbi:MAG TPA: efflux RND transporter periplasmic adaptor subunit [Longimicrobiales bacterium]|nr:efflux RND transporter periplasmic adaptor subunit [Longimicrobiales bacterium]